MLNCGMIRVFLFYYWTVYIVQQVSPLLLDRQYFGETLRPYWGNRIKSKTKLEISGRVTFVDVVVSKTLFTQNSKKLLRLLGCCWLFIHLLPFLMLPAQRVQRPLSNHWAQSSRENVSTSSFALLQESVRVKWARLGLKSAARWAAGWKLCYGTKDFLIACDC